MNQKERKHSFEELCGVIENLRSPEGCPWDREQTAETLSSDFIEEVYEAVDAIRGKDDAHLMEELGDVYLLVTMIAYIKQQEGQFKISDVLDGITEKLIRRHPHVFAGESVKDSDEVLKQWEDIKVHVEGRAPKKSILDKVSKGLPPLERAYKLQKKATKVGFDWPDINNVWDKVHEEIEEVRTVDEGNKEHLLEEVGDLLFSVVNIARYLEIDPAEAMHRCNSKFMKRFSYIEENMKIENLDMNADNFEKMDQLWNESKLK
ncbi:nucleoside triphosphate pyrophosphohydrolase [Oceanispirochaeta sp.]|jgi:tetrapyrrole methylase family protein/MazG family protein|uniref:nucleoside triphosphate pyrophosphohydrolase n=1 Tax=Oceanispirochaeta sp. TaxID=2035350 RepID=UPI002616E151|nr:nucleoside triphosphate pyrophosphohydrolase [Oceanispirochaeta sp.]MDA3955938.1 nucleoside triphosphate pyrophosphohydrolase [Oceanispirochaeta sp.]